MKESLFYIFASVTLLAAFFAAFSGEVKTSLKAAVYLMSGITGLLLLLNFHLFGLFLILFSLLLFALVILLKERISFYFQDTGAVAKVNFISLLLISLISAILAGLPGAAKWPQFDIMFGPNSIGLIFTKYFAAILGIGLLVSVIISAGYNILKNEAAE